MGYGFLVFRSSYWIPQIVQTVDGEAELIVPPNAQPGQQLVLKGRGARILNHPLGARGDHIVTLRVGCSQYTILGRLKLFLSVLYSLHLFAQCSNWCFVLCCSWAFAGGVARYDGAGGTAAAAAVSEKLQGETCRRCRLRKK